MMSIIGFRLRRQDSRHHFPQEYEPPTPVEMDDEDALNYRREMVSFGLEDNWRLKGDEVRVLRGLPTSQLWEWKDGRKAGEWVKYVE